MNTLLIIIMVCLNFWSNSHNNNHEDENEWVPLETLLFTRNTIKRIHSWRHDLAYHNHSSSFSSHLWHPFSSHFLVTLIIRIAKNESQRSIIMPVTGMIGAKKNEDAIYLFCKRVKMRGEGKFGWVSSRFSSHQLHTHETHSLLICVSVNVIWQMELLNKGFSNTGSREKFSPNSSIVLQSRDKKKNKWGMMMFSRALLKHCSY